MHLVTNWFKRTFSDPQVVFLTLFLTLALILIISIGDMLMPVLASAVIAYLLEGVVGLFERRGIPRLFAVVSVFCGHRRLLMRAMSADSRDSL